MKKVSIIGAGKLGASLGAAFFKKGYRIKAISCCHLYSAKESRKIIGEGLESTDNIKTAEAGEIVVLSIPDDQIKKTAEELASSSVTWQDKFIFHCSGLLSSKILLPLKNKGALTASIHPIQSFPKKRTPVEQFKNIYFGIEGSEKALESSKKIISDLGGKSITIQTENKPLYHTACTFASNLFITLINTAQTLLSQSGIEEQETFQMIQPLIQGTLNNMSQSQYDSPLTGPINRGDVNTIKLHLKALQTKPDCLKIYVAMAKQALEITKKQKKLPDHIIKEIENLL